MDKIFQFLFCDYLKMLVIIGEGDHPEFYHRLTDYEYCIETIPKLDLRCKMLELFVQFKICREKKNQFHAVLSTTN